MPGAQQSPWKSPVLFHALMQLLPGWRNKFPAGQAELAGDHGTATPGVPWGLWEREKLLGLPWDGNEIREREKLLGIAMGWKIRESWDWLTPSPTSGAPCTSSVTSQTHFLSSQSVLSLCWLSPSTAREFRTQGSHNHEGGKAL